MSQRLGPIAGGVLALGALALGGCAANNPRDPLEPYNRAMFNVNEHVDRAVLKPVAIAYKNVTPTPLRHGISNVFGNFDDMWSTANDFAQGHVAEAANGLLRVEVNTVFGLLGVIDIATEMGLYRHPNDFGLTLARYGIGAGPYFMIPLLGPSTVRDAAATPVDIYYGPRPYYNSGNVAGRNWSAALGYVDKRANLLATTDLIERIAIDPYVFTRDAYLQRRASRVRDVRELGVLGTGDAGAEAASPAASSAAAQP